MLLPLYLFIHKQIGGILYQFYTNTSSPYLYAPPATSLQANQEARHQQEAWLGLRAECDCEIASIIHPEDRAALSMDLPQPAMLGAESRRADSPVGATRVWRACVPAQRAHAVTPISSTWRVARPHREPILSPHAWEAPSLRPCSSDMRATSPGCQAGCGATGDRLRRTICVRGR